MGGKSRILSWRDRRPERKKRSAGRKVSRRDAELGMITGLKGRYKGHVVNEQDGGKQLRPQSRQEESVRPY